MRSSGDAESVADTTEVSEALDVDDMLLSEDAMDAIVEDAFAGQPDAPAEKVDKKVDSFRKKCKRKMEEMREYMLSHGMEDVVVVCDSEVAKMTADTLAPGNVLEAVHLKVYATHMIRGGFAREDRSAIAKEMPLVKSGEQRTCMADAFVQCLLLLYPDAQTLIRADHDKIRRELPTARDASVGDLNTMGERPEYRIVFKHVNGMTPKTLVKRREKVFLVMLKLTYTDGTSDPHAVVLHAPTRRILDSKYVTTVTDDDAWTNKTAMKPFRMWKNTHVSLTHVYEARVLEA